MTRHSFAAFMLVFGIASSGLSGCAPFEPPRDAMIGQTTEPYTLDSGDRLRVNVFGQPDLSGEFSVDGSGNIAIPLIPPVSAGGLTTNELQASIADALSAVAIAGGFSYRANQNTVHVTRKQGDRLVELDLPTGAPVRPGDTILVKERYF